MSKEIKTYTQSEIDILDAVSLISDPVVQTLSPKGGNVMFTDVNGTPIVSNDGINIAKSITVDNPIKNAIIHTIRETSLRTNSEAGDGTTTGILLTATLVREGIRMRNDGHNSMDICRVLRESSNNIISKLELQKKEVVDEHDMFNIAYISSNNDGELATKTVQAVKAVGVEGMVFIEVNNGTDDVIKEDLGFMIESGMLKQELRTHGNAASYENVPVFVTDKRLYYKEEAEEILKTVYKAGFKEVVIVAKDFIGECLPMLVAQHTGGGMKILLIRDNTPEDNKDVLEDLSVYVGATLVRDSEGSILNKLDIKQFGKANKVFSDRVKTIINSDIDNNIRLTALIDELRTKIKEDKDDKSLDKRLSCLASGMVTIKVGGSTETQIREKIYRYEDSVNALRTAMKFGYLPGGGVALLNCYDEYDYSPEYRQLFKRMCQASVVQIAKNCDKDVNYVLKCIEDFQDDEKDKNICYNAMTDSYENMIEAGIIDPFLVTKLVVENSLSAAANILSVNYYIVNKKENDK